MGGCVFDSPLCICQIELTPYVYPHALHTVSRVRQRRQKHCFLQCGAYAYHRAAYPAKIACHPPRRMSAAVQIGLSNWPTISTASRRLNADSR
jgi:hypothetical protein